MVTPVPPLPENMHKQAQTLIFTPDKQRRVLSWMTCNMMMCESGIEEDTVENILKLNDLQDHESHSHLFVQPPTCMQ